MSVIGIIAIVLGLVFGIRRLIKNSKQEYRSRKILKIMDESEEVVEAIANELDEKYFYISVNEHFDFQDYVKDISSKKTVGVSTIDFVREVDENTVILSTTCSTENIELKLTGKFGEVKKVFNILYSLKYHKEMKQVAIYSIYTPDGFQKGLRLSFAMKFFE